MQLEDSVLTINGIGNARVKKLHSLAIETVQDLIEYFPRDYSDRSECRKIKELETNQENTFYATIASIPENIRIKDKILTRVKVEDETGKITLVWYRQPYLKNTFKIGEQYLFNGKLIAKYGKKEIQSPEFEKKKDTQAVTGGRIVPVYSVTDGISQKVLRTLILDTLEKTKDQLQDFIPEWIRKKYRLSERNYAVSNIHFPQSNEDFFIARRRLVFEELFFLQAALLRMKSGMNEGKNGLFFSELKQYEALEKALPFTLTNAQKRVFSEIRMDIESGQVMNRLIQGDVGSGKTAIAMLSAFVAIKSGYQAVLMAPTEVLAGQHFESFEKLFQSFGIKTVLLSGSLKKKEKDQVLSEICLGEAQMIIGTHAVIQKTVTFSHLGLVITDEQHRFGVRQRGSLSDKGDNPHVLVMTATPIPRTLALILYGDLDISVLDELPPGRKKIDTSAVNSRYHDRIYDFIEREIHHGRQAYIICPMIEESEKLDVLAAVDYTQTLQETVLGEYEIACLHGKMKPQQKTEIMEAFSQGKTKILVSTTVIEVGINVPNATVMLIENAERFGLAQLHQLRGRVGRGAEKSYCILVSDSTTEITKERMKVMKQMDDGFEISEMDLKLRGPGEFFGTRQHGLPELKIANLYKDMEILMQAQKAAAELLKRDPILKKEEHNSLAEKIDMLLQVSRLAI